MAEAGGADNPARPAKRSLFKKSAWAKPVERVEAIDLFSRAKEIFPEVVAENLRNRQKQLQLKTSETVEVDSSIHEGKKRRISTEAEDFQGSSSDGELAARNEQRSSSSSAIIPQSPGKLSKSTDQEGSPTSSSKHCQYSPEDKVSNRSKTGIVSVISLDDSDSLEHTEKSPVLEKESAKPITIEESTPPRPEDGDKEFAEWFARARKGYKQNLSEPLDTHLSRDGLASKPKTISTVSSLPPPPSGPDPVVSILITSRIEGTKPCVFKRKLSQRFKDIRVGWCDRQSIDGQPMPEAIKSGVFLTWCMKRVFDVTTCKALGVKVNAQGMLYSDGDDFDPDGPIHLEVWTEELFELHKEQQAAERKRLVRDPLEEEEPAAPKEPPTQKLRIILKSKDDVLKLQVKPTTPISKLITSFRANKKVPHDKSITLFLDGDEIDPDSLVSDTDLEDMVTIDVHVN